MSSTVCLDVRKRSSQAQEHCTYMEVGELCCGASLLHMEQKDYFQILQENLKYVISHTRLGLG